MGHLSKFMLTLLLTAAHGLAAPPLNQAQVEGIVERLESGLNDYVFPDRAHAMQAYLRAHASEYRNITSPQVLAERLTADLRTVGKDKHLTIRYGTGVGPAAPTEPDHWHKFGLATSFGVEQVSRLPGNIAYMRIDYFADDPDAGAVIDAAYRLMQGSDALILDLRHNHGGSPVMVDALLSHLFPNRTQLTSIFWRERDKVHEDRQWTEAAASPAFLDNPVFVLDSSATFSAGEQCAYDLKATRRAVIVGEFSGGGANPANMPHDLGYDFDAFIPNGEAINPLTKTNWEGSGVQPDVAVRAVAALSTAYKLALTAAKPALGDELLMQEKARAMRDPAKALSDAGLAIEKQHEEP